MLDLQAKSSFRITEDSKFFTKLLSREGTAAESSFRLCCSVPFTWESRPGTPKNALSHSSLSLPPPLAPPPSYHRCYTLSRRPKPASKSPRSNLFNAFLTRISLKRVKSVASPRSSLSASPSSDTSVFLEQERLHNSASLDPDVDTEQPTTALCFGISGSHRRN